jgi:hypothetical protein
MAIVQPTERSVTPTTNAFVNGDRENRASATAKKTMALIVISTLAGVAFGRFTA